MKTPTVLVIGAGIGGLSAAVDLSRQGVAVTVLDSHTEAGGKLRTIRVAGQPIDAGPTVFTMRWVFDSLFADSHTSLDAWLPLMPATRLARHAWRAGGCLDLYADRAQSIEAIREFAGRANAEGYARFCQRSEAIYETLRDAYIASPRPTPFTLVRRLGLRGLPALAQTGAHSTLWRTLQDFFPDPRLQQLFGRYATYCGSSPLSAPATLMLVAHVEQAGVWLVDGGMQRIAAALQALGERQGAQYRLGQSVTRIHVTRGRVTGVTLATGETLAADTVLFNGDSNALAEGLLGDQARPATRPTARAQRSLSAITWSITARPHGFALDHHNVFFAEDYAREFRAIFEQRTITEAPTVYLCAQDRGPGRHRPPSGYERMLLLINAPADGDRDTWKNERLASIRSDVFAMMSRCGLDLEVAADGEVITTPTQFEALFPGTGGALYGRANHGMMGSFARAGSRSAIRGLYLAGGSVHPGPGVPMAAMSGRLAAASICADLARTRRDA